MTVPTDGGERLQEWRATAGPKKTPLSQEDLAKRLGVSQGTISHIEDGKSPSLALSVRIQELTGIEPAAFLRRPTKRRAG